MSEIKNGRLGLHGAEHSKCDRMMTLGLKRLKLLLHTSRAVSHAATKYIFCTCSITDHAAALM